MAKTVREVEFTIRARVETHDGEPELAKSRARRHITNVLLPSNAHGGGYFIEVMAVSRGRLRTPGESERQIDTRSQEGA